MWGWETWLCWLKGSSDSIMKLMAQGLLIGMGQTHLSRLTMRSKEPLETHEKTPCPSFLCLPSSFLMQWRMEMILICGKISSWGIGHSIVVFFVVGSWGPRLYLLEAWLRSSSLVGLRCLTLVLPTLKVVGSRLWNFSTCPFAKNGYFCGKLELLLICEVFGAYR